jgi:hypothetical protein
MSTSRSIEVRIDGQRLKALGGASGRGPSAPVAFRLHGDLPGLPTAARGEAFVAGLAKADPQLAERLGRLMPALLSHEAQLFEWLSRGDDHGRRFVEDPAGALAEAIPDLSPRLMADLRAVAQDLSTLGGTR